MLFRSISIVQGKSVILGDVIRNTLVTGMLECGATAEFLPIDNYKDKDFYKKSDSILQVEKLIGTRSTNGYIAYASTYEITLQDIKSGTNVWRFRMELLEAAPTDPITKQLRGEPDARVVWANAVLAQMKKDGIFSSCK